MNGCFKRGGCSLHGDSPPRPAERPVTNCRVNPRLTMIRHAFKMVIFTKVLCFEMCTKRSGRTCAELGLEKVMEGGGR